MGGNAEKGRSPDEAFLNEDNMGWIILGIYGFLLLIIYGF